MNVDRNHHAAAVADGKIYVIGGMDDDNWSSDSVEVYNTQANS